MSLTFKPNLFLAGAAKSGTSSLFAYLERHPDVYMSPMKEPHYFCADRLADPFTGPGDEGFSRKRLRDLDAYLHLFEAGATAAVRGEGSVYYIYFPGIAERLMAFNPDAKVILILRNPVDRAFSAYMHTVRDGRETRSFEAALEQEAPRRAQGYQPLWWYRELGLYSEQVARYQRAVPHEQLKIFLFDDLRNMPQVLSETFTFLDIPHAEIDTSVRYNESGVPKSQSLYRFFAQPNGLKAAIKPLLPVKLRQQLGQQAKAMTLRKKAMNPKTRAALLAYYRDDMLRLQELLGRDLSNWLKA